MDAPLFSIVMPTYNSELYVEEAVDSVLAQTVHEWELLIVDDCSSDRTMEILRRYEARDSRIRIFQKNENGGPARARNVAIEASRGRYIAFLDSDDAWRADKLKRQLSLFERTGAALVYSGYEKMDQYGGRDNRVVVVPERVDYKGLLKATVIATATAVYDTERVGRVRMPDIRKRQDFALWLKILRMGGEARAVMEPLAFLRKRPGSVSSNKVSAAAYVWRVYREVEGMSVVASLYHFGQYAYRAFLKARI